MSERLVVSICMALLLMLAPAPVRADVTLVAEGDGRVVYNVDFTVGEGDAASVRLATPGLPRLQYERLFVSVPHDATIRVSITGAEWQDVPGVPTVYEGDEGMRPDPLPSEWREGVYPRQPARLGQRFTFRGTRVQAIDCFAEQVDYGAATVRRYLRYTVTVEFSGTEMRRMGRPDPLVEALVANTPMGNGRPWATRGARTAPDPHLSRSVNWARVWIDETGVYRITGADLTNIGVNIAAIADPSSFRLFTAGGRSIELDLAAGTGTWAPGNWMPECDIVVDYGNDGSFDPTDRIVFYGVGLGDYLDRYVPGAPRDSRTDHLFADENMYFLTWDDAGFPGSPGRMASVAAAPAGGNAIATFEERIYFEQDIVREFNVGGDGWYWRAFPPRPFSETIPFPSFNVVDLDASQPQAFRTVALAEWSESFPNNHHAEYLLNGIEVAEAFWTTAASYRYDDAIPVEARAAGLLVPGTNRFSLRIPRDVNGDDFMLFAFYEIRYHRFLKAQSDRLFFSSPGDTSGTIDYAVDGFSPSGSLFLFDVTDQFHPRQLTGFSEVPLSATEREVRFSLANSGTRQYLWAGASSAFMAPARLSRMVPRDLRNASASPNMLIVTDPSMVGAASVLRQFRQGNLPLFANGAVDVVTTVDIYDNFSGGVPDPLAIRNYCKFLYDNFDDGAGSPALAYLLLLGDANDDYKQIANAQPNFVPTNVNFDPISLDAYATDEWFALMDEDDFRFIGHKFADIAVGRLPAASTGEAAFIVQKVIDYETQTDFGPWRDRVILVADDETSPVGGNRQDDFVAQSEFIATSRMSRFLDPVKVYLTEFASVQQLKPASRQFLIEAWNEGALILNYVGHGSSKQMADEQVFVDTDVPNLNNATRLPVAMAFSCTLGKFATAQSKSLAEKLLFKDGGGAIATIAATELTFITTNRVLNFNVVEGMVPPEPGKTPPLGVTMLEAKSRALDATIIIDPNTNQPRGSVTVEENNQKYNLLGDPAMRLLAPRREIRFEAASVDSFVPGMRTTVRGSVYLDGNPDASFSGTVRLVAREPDDPDGYTRDDGFHIAYRYPGGTIYEGDAAVENGEFAFSFRVPRSARTGDLGYLLAYADNQSVDAVALKGDAVFRPPVAADSTALEPVDGPPRVRLGFEGKSRKIKPGAILEARVQDGDGVNILSTTPEGKLGLVFDRSNLPIDVTDFFEFDFGGADTSGTLRFPLPADLPVGPHEATLKVSDTFGQTRLDTVTFTLTDALDYSAQVVLNYPNPFESSTHFLFELTDRARISLEIFTLSGRRIRKIEQTADGGEAWIFWDGRDHAGDSIANGTYLYVARVNFLGVDRPASKLRGKIVKIE